MSHILYSCPTPSSSSSETPRGARRTTTRDTTIESTSLHVSLTTTSTTRSTRQHYDPLDHHSTPFSPSKFSLETVGSSSSSLHSCLKTRQGGEEEEEQALSLTRRRPRTPTTFPPTRALSRGVRRARRTNTWKRPLPGNSIPKPITH